MNISVFSPTYPAQEALRKIDDATGARTREAFISAWVKFPHLAKIAILQDDSVPMPTIRPEVGNLAKSTVLLSGKVDSYRPFVDDKAYAARMNPFNEFYRSRGVTPSISEMITTFFLHELGHGDDFHRYIREAAGDARAAFALANRVRGSELASLPLGTATSIADAAWQHNTDGYRDRLQAEGWTDEKRQAMRLQNLTAYTELNTEQIADRFALGVLATVYPAQEHASAPGLGTFKVYGQATSGSDYNVA